MEDLVPLLIFVVIAVVNMLKYAAEKSGKKKAEESGETVPRATPSSLEKFFEELAEKVEPKTTELPDWPEGIERPDYVGEMNAQKQQPEVMPIEPTPIAPVAPMAPPPVAENIAPPEPLPTAFRSTASSLPNISFRASAMRITSAPILRSHTAGQIDFPLKNKAQLRQAMIANLIFSQPRACDRSFDNTVAK